MALGWIGATTALASVVRNPNSWCSPSTGLALVPRVPCHVVQIPAKASSGRLSSRANHVGVLRGLVSAYSQKLVKGTRQRFFGPSHARQCGLLVLRMLVTACVP
jgi:hypothetical protein